jgi:hypothetical protein
MFSSNFSYFTIFNLIFVNEVMPTISRLFYLKFSDQFPQNIPAHITGALPGLALRCHVLINLVNKIK